MKKSLFILVTVFCMCLSARAANNCTGATYYDSTSDTCISCPAGYDANTDAGKTSINQCQIHCDAGTYIRADSINLLDDSFMNNSTYGDVTVNGVATARAKILPTENGKTYTLSATLIPTGTYYYYLKEINPDGTVLNSQCSSMWNNYNATNANDTVKKTCTFTARNNATYVVYFATVGSPNVLTLTDYKMVEGLMATPYNVYDSVPAGYTPLEYIEFNGAQYIDTGIVLSNASGMELVMEMQSNTSDGTQTWVGFKNLSGAQIRYEIDFYNNKWMIGVRTKDSNSLVSTNTGVHTIKFDTYNKAPKLYDTDGTLLIDTSVSSTTLTDNTLSLYIGARNDDGSPVNFVNGRIGRTYLVQERKKLYDYIPVRSNSDNVIGLYDTISNTFFTNAGTGSFNAGPAVTGPCQSVWPGYWSAASTVNYGSAGIRNACPTGTTTVGYGHGADSANDCGRTLHVGDNVLYMRKNKETSPALHIQMKNGDMFYVNLSPTNHNISKLHLWHNGGEYTAYDDSLFYNERDFVTGAQTTP